MMVVSPIHLVAQGHNSGDWVQLIALLAMVLISAVGGLIKRYAESRRREQTATTPPGQKTRATANWRQKLEQELERIGAETTGRTTRESEADRTPSYDATEDSSRKSEREPNVPPAMAKTRERERLAREAVAAAKDIRESTSEPALEPVGLSSETQASPSSAPTETRVLIDLSSPDALRRAIIQYEVLGRPLGLRDLPSEGGAGRVY
jgi:hypothetical protein